MKNPKSLIVSAVVVLLIYMATLMVPPGWITYLLSAPAYIVLALTALARINDIKPEQEELRWDFRRNGLALTGAVAIMYLVGPLFDQYPSWRATLIAWGVALVWLTTPGMPPWWKWMTEEHVDLHLWDKLKAFAKSLFGK